LAGATDDALPRPDFDTPPRIALIVAPYYRDIADQLIDGARTEIAAVDGRSEVIEVPGALEIGPALRAAWMGGDFDGFVALGCVIRGETYHFELVCNESSRALTLLGLQGAAIGNGVLTVETLEQARVRADPAGQNKGGGAAAACLHLIALGQRFLNRPRGIGFRPDGLRLAGDADGGANIGRRRE